jgi:hypothetical protein
MRILLLILTLAFASFAAVPLVADAQPTAPARPPRAPAAGQPGQPATVKATVVTKYPHGDRVESKGKGMALLFWMFAAASVGGALFVVTRRNLIAAGWARRSRGLGESSRRGRNPPPALRR